MVQITLTYTAEPYCFPQLFNRLNRKIKQPAQTHDEANRATALLFLFD